MAVFIPPEVAVTRVAAVLRFPVYGREERTDWKLVLCLKSAAHFLLNSPLHAGAFAGFNGALRGLLLADLCRENDRICSLFLDQMEDPPADSDQGPVVQVAEIRWPLTALPLRLLEWKVKPGTLVNVDSVLALCAPISQDKGAETARLPEKKVKADRAGVVKELCCQLGQVIPPG